MQERVVILVLSLVVAASLSGCSSAVGPAGRTAADSTSTTGSQPAPAATALTFSGKYGVTFNYPVGWTVVTPRLQETKTADGSVSTFVRFERAGVGYMEVYGAVASQGHDAAAAEASNKAYVANLEKLWKLGGQKFKKITVAGLPGVYYQGAPYRTGYSVICMAFKDLSIVQASGQTTSTAAVTQKELVDAVALVTSTIRLR